VVWDGWWDENAGCVRERAGRGRRGGAGWLDQGPVPCIRSCDVCCTDACVGCSPGLKYCVGGCDRNICRECQQADGWERDGMFEAQTCGRCRDYYCSDCVRREAEEGWDQGDETQTIIKSCCGVC
jgi:hypothetical protein